MSAAAFGKAIGPIAKKIGGEVAEGLSKTADDWGWKGPKKGEISGSEVISAFRGSMGHSFDNAVQKMDDQLRNSSNPKARKEAGIPSALHMAGRFAKLEEADIPREWTGKVLMAIKQRERSNIYGRPADRIGTSPYTGISRIMRPMTNEQRETFVSLYPEWEGTLEELANAARLL